MISGALKICRRDIPVLEQEIREEAARYTEERVRIVTILSSKELEDFLKRHELADIICVDVSAVNGIAEAELLRKNYPKAAIILIADVNMSPILYMKPSILASSLLLKPLTKERIHQVVRDIFAKYIEKVIDEEVFLIETREEKYRLPLSSILYFEARQKKIYACTEREEYGFYETMDHLEERMGGEFVRCHRSYMANRSLIDKIMLSKNCIVLKQGIEIPLSRSYKTEAKKLMKNKEITAKNG